MRRLEPGSPVGGSGPAASRPVREELPAPVRAAGAVVAGDRDNDMIMRAVAVSTLDAAGWSTSTWRSAARSLGRRSATWYRWAGLEAGPGRRRRPPHRRRCGCSDDGGPARRRGEVSPASVLPANDKADPPTWMCIRRMTTLGEHPPPKRSGSARPLSSLAVFCSECYRQPMKKSAKAPHFLAEDQCTVPLCWPLRCPTTMCSA